MTSRGVYIAFEGGEGSGKSTQASLLARQLDAAVTREPGGTALGQRLRALLLDSEGLALGARAEALMMAADRAQHIDEVVRPTLEAGRHVVSDRTFYSSLAYQGAGRGLGIDQVADLNRWATNGCVPDLVVLLTVASTTAAGRLGRSLDRIEQAGERFHRVVNETFAELAAADPERWIVIDASGSIDEVAESVHQLVGEAMDTLTLGALR